MERQRHARPRDEATERIECYVLQRGLTPHSKLPSERDMCEMWGFNRTTLRSAIKRLIMEGRLYNKQGSGTYVAPPRLERNLQDVQSTTDAVLAVGHRLKTQVLSARLLAAERHEAQKLGLPEGSMAFYLQRLRIMDGEPIMVEYSYLDYARCPHVEEHDFTDESLYDVLAHYNIVIDHGREEIGITYTTEEEAALLGLTPGMPVFYLSGVSCDEAGQPIEYFKSVVRSDKACFSSVLTR